MSFACVIDREFSSAASMKQMCNVRNDGARLRDVVTLLIEIPALFADLITTASDYCWGIIISTVGTIQSLCMSMMTKAVDAGSTAPACGHLYGSASTKFRFIVIVLGECICFVEDQ